jgi:hypothetical protein
MAGNVYDLLSTEQGIKWMHAVCGFPVKSTWLKAIVAGNFIGWPQLTVQNVKKYYPETTETPKGHLNQTRKNVGDKGNGDKLHLYTKRKESTRCRNTCLQCQRDDIL